MPSKFAPPKPKSLTDRELFRLAAGILMDVGRELHIAKINYEPILESVETTTERMFDVADELFRRYP